MGSRPTRLTLVQRALLIISAAAVYAVNFWPSRQVTRAGLIALGSPEYVGFNDRGPLASPACMASW
jgi:hypothetical protein